MKYTVTWKPSAENRLVELWLNATDRAAVTAAANELEKMLQIDPHGQGESRADGSRVLFVPPLGALYDADDGNRFVDILKVWRFRS